MILHERRKRPEPWQTQRTALRYSWMVPLLAIEWVFDWTAFALSRWSFLEVLEYLGSFSILIAVIFYFSESGDRLKQKHYQAWQVINTAQGKGGNGGRVDALQELNADGVPLVGVDASGAFLQGIRLARAKLQRANLSSVDARNSNFDKSDLQDANLRSANFRESDFRKTDLRGADLSESDLTGAAVTGALNDGAILDCAELTESKLGDLAWKKVASLKGANIHGVQSAPPGFVEWALQHGVVDSRQEDNSQ